MSLSAAVLIFIFGNAEPVPAVEVTYNPRNQHFAVTRSDGSRQAMPSAGATYNTLTHTLVVNRHPDEIFSDRFGG